MVCSTVGGSTITVWKRRSKAASLSMYLRYSFIVVAPTTCNSPRESAGLMMLLASIAPSAEPAPTMVCSSSTKRMTFFERLISSMTALMRSSNWPRYFVPATINARLTVEKWVFLSASARKLEDSFDFILAERERIVLVFAGDFGKNAPEHAQ